MATKKTAKKTTTAKKTPAKKTSTQSATATKVTRVSAADTKPKMTKSTAATSGKKLPDNLINIVLAELVGTFALTLVALYTAQILGPLYMGLTLMVIVLGVGAISGAHINPAVTFGLWSMRKLKTVLVPFYWAAQFVGAMAAVVLLGAISGGGFALDFSNFGTFSWGVFAAELVAAAIFLFGLSSVLFRKDTTLAATGLGVGISLTIGLIVGGTLITQVSSSVDQSKITSAKDIPHELRVKDVTANPAVSLAITERTDSELQGGMVQATEKQYSRFSIEVILATLIGAALGGNLYLLIAYRNGRKA